MSLGVRLVQGWGGASPVVVQGFWVWENGERYIPGRTTAHWHGGEPNNSGNKEDCAEMYLYANGATLWNDNQCWRTRHFVCHLQGMAAPTVLPRNAIGGNASYAVAATAPLALAGSGGMCLGVTAPVVEGSPVVLKPCATALRDEYTIRHMSVPVKGGSSGWRLVLRHTLMPDETGQPFWWPQGAADYGGGNSSTPNFAALSDLEQFRGPDGGFEFKLVWPDSCAWEQWRQESNPLTDHNIRNTEAAPHFSAVVTTAVFRWAHMRGAAGARPAASPAWRV
ncbi:hypothetical protein CYMTET_25663 [Cymbomonas tetramitiformis]|uniref:C-type lectin domain-containing protein n=1 Tax=Cymbomonas tetramitiformis TaxID=36881 RepID=A0AAE0FTS4_9CHLO|nr:hypothetical protein CYMTET_25663 [Cymbomonas tetramitiformis]